MVNPWLLLLTRSRPDGGPLATRRQRVVVIHSSDEHYGSDRVLLDVLRVLDQRPATEVVVLLPDDVPHGPTPLCTEITRRHPTIRVEHVAVPVARRSHRSPAAGVALAGRTIGLAHRLRHLQPDLVWCATSATLPAAISARVARVFAVAVHIHEIWSGPTGCVLRLLARLTNARVAVSAAVEQATRLRAPRATVALNAVATLVANPVANPVATRRDGPSGRAMEFMVASRWGWWKGHATLLAAWSLAGSPGHLTILGERPRTGGGVDVRQLVRRHVANPATVTIAGEVDDIGTYLDRTDVLVLPSDRPEPFGLVIIEAFARGVPVIATRAGGVPEIVTDGVDGWLVEPGDIDALATRLASITPVEVARAGQRAVATHRARFTPEVFDTTITGVIETQLTPATAGTRQAAPQRQTRAWLRPARHTAP